jgi:uncharacterized protein (DUF433 family)
MTHEELLQRISIDPAVCGGKPCIRGHRIWVSLIVDLFSSGMSVEEILEEYPQVTAEDIRACLAYASEMTREPDGEVRSVHDLTADLAGSVRGPRRPATNDRRKFRRP